MSSSVAPGAPAPVLVVSVPLGDGVVTKMGHTLELTPAGGSIVSADDLGNACLGTQALDSETCLSGLGAFTQAATPKPLRAFVRFDLELGQAYTASPASPEEDDRPNGPW